MIGWREHGSKPGSGGANSETISAIDRRERLRQLALETIDLSKDPYFMKNNIGTFECKLCLTLHPNEGNYLAHTQGKRHQTNLARRAAREAIKRGEAPAPTDMFAKPKIMPKKTIKIGRPGYRYTKQKDPESGQNSLLFQIDYPEIEDGFLPRYRFMSAFEQKKEAADPQWQYLLFAAEPYETVAFKIPNKPIERSIEAEPGQVPRFWTNWDKERKVFTLQLTFKRERQVQVDVDGPFSNPIAPSASNPLPPADDMEY